MADFFERAGRFTLLRALVWLTGMAGAIYWAVSDPHWLSILIAVCSPMLAMSAGWILAWFLPDV